MISFASLALLLQLLAMHALLDFPLQGDFLAKAKNPLVPIPGLPWWYAMGSHALIHAGGVWVVTGSLTLAAVEIAAHFTIDTLKCRGAFGFLTDQALHIACKLGYVAIILSSIGRDLP